MYRKRIWKRIGVVEFIARCAMKTTEIFPD